MMRAMKQIEHTAKKDADTPMIESQMLPDIGFGWPRWLVRHLSALFKRA
jgi:hypothetical protein